MYRVGFPGWKWAARLGIPMFVRVDIHFDSAVSSYWTSSPDLGGLIVTGDTLSQVRQEVDIAVAELMELELGRPISKAKPHFKLTDDLQTA